LRIEGVPFMTTDWSKVSRPSIRHDRRGSVAHVEQGNIRVRMLSTVQGTGGPLVSSRSRLAVLEGELVTELEDGTRVVLTPGMSYQVADNTGAHRSHTGPGAKLFIVD